MTPDQKCEFWQQHINAWQQGKLSQKQYCQQQGLGVANFGYWRTRLKGGAKPKARAAFISVNVVEAASASVTVVLPVGLRLEFPTSSLEILLPVIVRSLQEAS